jgi:hypothetical protein
MEAPTEATSFEQRSCQIASPPRRWLSSSYLQMSLFRMWVKQKLMVICRFHDLYDQSCHASQNLKIVAYPAILKYAGVNMVGIQTYP